MIDPTEIDEQMEVIGADGGHVGTVDRVEGDRIKLSRSNRGAGGQHHYIDMSLIAGVEDGCVRLSVAAEQAPQFWKAEEEAV